MQIDVIGPFLLTLATAFSWRRTLPIFDGETTASVANSPLTMIATAISLSGFGLAYDHHGPCLGSLIALVSIMLAAGVRRLTATVVVIRFITENACRSLKELVFPLFDLVGMHIELLGQFHQRLFAADGGERHFCLESGRGSGAVLSSLYLLSPASKPKSGRKSTYPRCADSRANSVGIE